jgi:ribonuclease P protein component
MLPKKKRLTKKEFSEVFEKGERKKENGFLFAFSPCVVGEEKVSVVCSKKVAPKAFFRNKKKRRIYSCLEQNEHVWFQSGFDLVVVVQETKANRPYNILCDDLLEAMKGIMITE